MPTPTYKALATRTLTGTATTITFSSIPATYRDLILVIEGTYSTGTGNVRIRFNSDSSSSYPWVYMLASGTTSASAPGTSTSIPTGGFDSSTRNVAFFNILDYSATDKHKTVLSRSGEGTVAIYAWAGRWPSTAAINSVSVVGQNPLAIGTTLSLYGIIS